MLKFDEVFKKSNLIILIILPIFFILQFSNLRTHTQSFRFGDESEHLTPGWMMAKWGTKLYTELSTNHQPIPILTSLVFFKTVKYPNLFMLIERIRQFMLAISFIGALVLVIKFRLVGLISALLIGTVAFWLLGFHVLAESLTLYPTIFIMGITVKHIFWRNQQMSTIFQTTENILFGLCIFLIGFSLLPSWPFLIISSTVYFFLIDARSRKVTVLSAAIPTVLLFLIIDLKEWFNDTVITNLKYFIPYEAEANNFKSYFAILTFPFLSLLKPTGPVAKYFLFLTLISINAATVILIKSEQRVFTVLKFLLVYALVILLNLRVPKIDIGFYTAFHVLPQLGAFTILAILLTKLAIDEIGNKPKQKTVFLFVSGSLILATLFSNTAWWRETKDKMEEHFIQYGEIQSLGSALNKLKLENDRFLVGPLEGLLNIASELPVAGRQNAYLDWSYRSEESRRNLNSLMNDNPPTFVYFPEGGPYFDLLEPILNLKYTRLERFDGGLTYAYILNSEINKRSKKQWQEFEDLFYKIPEQALR